MSHPSFSGTKAALVAGSSRLAVVPFATSPQLEDGFEWNEPPDCVTEHTIGLNGQPPLGEASRGGIVLNICNLPQRH
jgi:hypothetical protein